RRARRVHRLNAVGGLGFPLTEAVREAVLLRVEPPRAHPLHDVILSLRHAVHSLDQEGAVLLLHLRGLAGLDLPRRELPLHPIALTCLGDRGLAETKGLPRLLRREMLHALQHFLGQARLTAIAHTSSSVSLSP